MLNCNSAHLSSHKIHFRNAQSQKLQFPMLSSHKIHICQAQLSYNLHSQCSALKIFIFAKLSSHKIHKLHIKKNLVLIKFTFAKLISHTFSFSMFSSQNFAHLQCSALIELAFSMPSSALINSHLQCSALVLENSNLQCYALINSHS